MGPASSFCFNFAKRSRSRVGLVRKTRVILRAGKSRAVDADHHPQQLHRRLCSSLGEGGSTAFYLPVDLTNPTHCNSPIRRGSKCTDQIPKMLLFGDTHAEQTNCPQAFLCESSSHIFAQTSGFSHQEKLLLYFICIKNVYSVEKIQKINLGKSISIYSKILYLQTFCIFLF